MSAPPRVDGTPLSLQDGNQSQRPPRGHLTILHTKAEVEARFKPIEAFITSVPATRASITLR